MRITFHSILLFVFLTVSTIGQQISFEKEILNIYVQDSVCSLDGKYFFRNNSEKLNKFSIYYPIAINGRQDYPNSIIVEDNNYNEIPFVKDKKGVRFYVTISADTILPIIIEYTQNVSNNSFEYILESTQSWGKPLESAVIKLHIPKELCLIKTSFNYNRVKKQKDKLVYIIEKENFLPDKNLKIIWRNK